MAKFNGYVLTEKGRELLARGLAGEKIEFTKMQIGDGVSSIDARNMTALVSPKQDLQLLEIEVNGGQCNLTALLDNKNIATGFYIRELGVFARGSNDIDVLYAYNVSTNPDFIPPFSANNIVEIEYVDTLIVDQATNVTAVIDASITYVTKETADRIYVNKDMHATENAPGITKYGTLSGTALEGHQMARILGIADNYYGGLISNTGTKLIGHAYYDANTKQMYLSKETNNLNYVDLNKFTPFSNKSLLDKLENLSYKKLTVNLDTTNGINIINAYIMNKMLIINGQILDPVFLNNLAANSNICNLKTMIYELNNYSGQLIDIVSSTNIVITQNLVLKKSTSQIAFYQSQHFSFVTGLN